MNVHFMKIDPTATNVYDYDEFWLVAITPCCVDADGRIQNRYAIITQDGDFTEHGEDDWWGEDALMAHYRVVFGDRGGIK